MRLYDRIEFLEFFDTEKILDEEAGLFEYYVTSPEGITFDVYINLYECTICFTLTSKDNTDLVDFAFHNMHTVVCDTNKPGSIYFLFYQEGKEDPVVTALIKPVIALSLNTE